MEEGDRTSFMIVITANKQSFLINGDAAQSWGKFIEQVSDMLQESIGETPKFQFKLDNDKVCLMSKPCDYQNMRLFCSMTARKVVEVELTTPKKVTGRTTISTPQINARSPQTANITNTTNEIRPLFDLNQPPAEENTTRVVNGQDSFVVDEREFESIYGISRGTIDTQNLQQLDQVPTHLQIQSAVELNSTRQHDMSVFVSQQKMGVLNSTGPGTTAEATGKNIFDVEHTVDFPTYDNSPEEEPVVLRSANWAYYIKHVGQEFKGGVNEFRNKLVMYAAKLGFKFTYIRNDAVYVHAKCALQQAEKCGWYVKGALNSVSQTFVIKEANTNHTCTLSVMGYDTKRLGCRLIGNLITDAIRATPTLTATDLKQELLTYYGFNISYDKVWRAVEVARANIFGGYADSFDELRWYAAAILHTNPGSEVFLETEPHDNRFKRFFLAFNASLEGFKKCRPMLFVDGTFMKTRYKGTLLAATAKDGNNGLFPVAIAIVEGENSANWKWFITKIKDLVHHPQEIMFVSDRAGGLMSAFDEVYEKPLHFFCLYHLMQNLRSMYKGRKYSDVYKNTMCKLLREAAYAPNKHYYEVAIQKFKLRGGPEAQHFLNDLPPEKWAISFAPDVHRYGELTSNAAESFNSWILEARALPITFMIDCIRMKLMRWFNERRDLADKWTGALTARAEEMWNQNDSLGDNWAIKVTNQYGVYEVLCPTSTVVNLNKKLCSCYQWQIRGFPCSHAIAVIKRSKWHIRQLVDSCFFTDTYKDIYAENIFPIPTTEKFEMDRTDVAMTILPPVIRRQFGRPRVKRFKVDAQGHKQREFICGRCGEYGNHFWTTCKEALYD